MPKKCGLPKGIRETKPGVFFLGKDRGNRGSNTYFDTNDTMGTAGEPQGSLNFLGDIRTGRIENPNGIMAVNYALSKESYLPAGIKAKIQVVAKHLQCKQ